MLVDRSCGVGAVVLANGTAGPVGPLVRDLVLAVREAEPVVHPAWSPATEIDDDALALVGTWYWGPYGYGLRLRADGLLELTGLAGPGRASRFRARGDGSWLGLDGYHAGEVLRVVRDDDGLVVALDLGSFVFSRTPYDPAAPQPGGVDEQGWRAGPA